MQDKDIRRLFQKAEIQVCPEQKRILKMYEYLQNEIDKNEYKNKKQRKRTEISLRDILWQQFRLIDKTYVIVYIMAVFAGFALMVFLQYAGTGKNDAIMVSMIISGCLSTLSVCGINKLYFGKMAELGASCYFNTKQCVAAWMVMSGMINVVVLFLLAGYLNGFWHVGLLQVGLYILTPYLLSGMIALGILSMETGKKHSFLFVISGFLMSIGYGVLGAIPGIMFTAANRIWTAVFILSLLLFVIQIKRLFNKMEKGDVLCMN